MLGNDRDILASHLCSLAAPISIGYGLLGSYARAHDFVRCDIENYLPLFTTVIVPVRFFSTIRSGLPNVPLRLASGHREVS